MAELTYEIVEEIGVLSEDSRGWRKELNIVSWNNREPKYDLRTWNPEHKRMSKGITFNQEEAEKLRDLLMDDLNGQNHA